MRAITFDQPGDADVLHLAELPDPQPNPHDLLVTVQAAGVNRADILQRRGLYPPPPGESEILGLEIAGTVTAIGNQVSRFKPGDRVFGLVAGGGYAEQCLLHEDLAMRLPEGWDMTKGAAVTEVFFTANENLFELGGLQAGETVLIHAGGSGVGSAAIQMASHIGARVMTTVGSSAKQERCLTLGADDAINYKTDDFAERIIEITDGDGVDCVLDFIGANYLDRHLKILRPGGRLVVVGLLGGAKAELNLGKLLSKRLHIMGSVMRALSVQEKTGIRQRFEHRWWQALCDGHLKPVIDRVFDLDEATAAHRHMEASRHFGKILLKP